MPTHVRVVRQWCQSLGVLTAVSISRPEAEMKLAAYVPLLQDRFPDGAFTADSLEHVARHCIKGFPTYAELAGYLSDWWRDNRPRPTALPPPPPPPKREPPTPEEIEYVHARVVEVVRALGPTRYADQDYAPAKPRHLTPEQLDQLNPLPNGRKRTDAQQATVTVSVSEAGAAAVVDSDAAESVAPADTTAGDGEPGARAA